MCLIQYTYIGHIYRKDVSILHTESECVLSDHPFVMQYTHIGHNNTSHIHVYSECDRSNSSLHFRLGKYLMLRLLPVKIMWSNVWKTTLVA